MYHYKAEDGATEEWHFSTDDGTRHRIVATASYRSNVWTVQHYECPQISPRKLIHTAEVDGEGEVVKVVAALLDIVGYTIKH